MIYLKVNAKASADDTINGKCSISCVGPALCLHSETTANGKCKSKDYKDKSSSAMLECKVLKCASAYLAITGLV